MHGQQKKSAHKLRKITSYVYKNPRYMFLVYGQFVLLYKFCASVRYVADIHNARNK